ncbi:hypothetical protein ABZ478_13695 [Streptomyces sp. NPDC005706]|uniref:hypothetical protein n=1 Tax=Streptomyces sp. NPDC005706 TaxID=3157169 RepID=UPI0033E3A5EE
MGWGEAPGRPGGNAYWSTADLSAAAAMGGAQLPAAGLLWWIVVSTAQDDYGAGSVDALGALCVLLFAPLLLPLLGMALTFVLTLPAVVLARLAGRHLGGPSWLRYLVAPLAPAVLWGGATVPLWSFTTSVPVLTALGVLPTLWVGCARRRDWRQWGVWWRAAAGSAVLFVAALAGGFLLTETGLVEQYEPPELTTAQLAGSWHGDGGAELRLSPDGRATAVRLPAQPPDYDWLVHEYVECAGGGTWKPHHQDDLGRDGILLRLDGDCGEDTDWSFGGTEKDPELYVLFGDPDGGRLWILKRTG